MTAQSYEQWMAEVDRIVEATCGLSVHDLPDWMSRDAYDDGSSPEEGAQQALEGAGGW